MGTESFGKIAKVYCLIRAVPFPPTDVDDTCEVTPPYQVEQQVIAFDQRTRPALLKMNAEGPLIAVLDDVDARERHGILHRDTKSPTARALDFAQPSAVFELEVREIFA